jgi:hypothetical protein
MKYVGCTIEEFKTHLQAKFKEDMTWENYGTAWHIDHIIPCAAFDLKDSVQLHACFHFSNMQPLWADENVIKKDHFKEEDKVAYLENFVSHV